MARAQTAGAVKKVIADILALPLADLLASDLEVIRETANFKARELVFESKTRGQVDNPPGPPIGPPRSQGVA